MHARSISPVADVLCCSVGSMGRPQVQSGLGACRANMLRPLGVRLRPLISDDSPRSAPCEQAGGSFLPAPPMNDPRSFAGRAAQQRGRDELALRLPLTCAGAIATGLPLDRPDRARRRPACRPATEAAAGPAMLHREHRALPGLDDSDRQRHWRCREHHNPIRPARRPRRRRAHLRHVRGHRSELAGELHRLAGTRRLKGETQAHDLRIRERWAGKDTRWAHGLHPPRPLARRRYRSCVI